MVWKHKKQLPTTQSSSKDCTIVWSFFIYLCSKTKLVGGKVLYFTVFILLTEKPTEKPLKLVLKVTEPVPEVYAGESEERRHKHKKKKKKKSSEKEKHRHHDEVS